MTDRRPGQNRRERGRRTSGARLRRRLCRALALGVALVALGALYSGFAPRPQVATAQADQGLIAEGRELYNGYCITCHGANLQGVEGRGQSLVGVGDAAVYFQVSTGRMPLSRQEEQALRKRPLDVFDPDTALGQANLARLGAFVQAHGGGPVRPAEAGAELLGDDVAQGGALYRLNCASCHNFTGRGGALTGGKFAPSLDEATPTQMYTAMLSGPQSMPRFSELQLTPEEKRDIIAYVMTVRGTHPSVGGYGLLGIGPTAEGIAVFIVGLAAMIGIALWIGART